MMFADRGLVIGAEAFDWEGCVREILKAKTKGL